MKESTGKNGRPKKANLADFIDEIGKPVPIKSL